jgi:hypothetical protein
MTTHSIPTAPNHEAFRQELLAVMKRHIDQKNLSAIEALAICAAVTGMCIALQDKNAVTPDQAMEVVSRNIEIGNARMVMESTGNTEGSG